MRFGRDNGQYRSRWLRSFVVIIAVFWASGCSLYGGFTASYSSKESQLAVEVDPRVGGFDETLVELRWRHQW